MEVSKELEQMYNRIKNKRTYEKLKNLETDIKVMNNKKKELEWECSGITTEKYIKFIQEHSKDGQVKLSDVEECMKLLAWEVYLIGKESE